jgi:pyruvate,water dikinase
VKRDSNVGNKAHSIRLLQRHGFRIPLSYVIPAFYKELYLKEPERILAQLEKEFQSELEPGLFYAVRSSAGIEDGLTHSFAGQFETVLNVSGPTALSAAVEKI